MTDEKAWKYVGDQKRKTWTYAEITASAEKEIRRMMACAWRADSHPRTAQQFRDWAYGTFVGWNGLTTGWQIDGDSERLAALTDPAKGSDW
ncbi:hypothetical protein AWB67_04733 [Caballeronia terrestris]|uniref:Uncharacterized protein n=1 Tax=Caballeronia terrestris TaxID=1226301 RepID=A0A158K411_9BURK|nr:hypothetical protein [Caballeronia terrestris]SAL75270.1 hypothetical protein AWB67_04733 [Caballeronia terrestris]